MIGANLKGLGAAARAATSAALRRSRVMSSRVHIPENLRDLDPGDACCFASNLLERALPLSRVAALSTE